METAPAQQIQTLPEVTTIDGVRIGKVVTVDPQGVVYVDFPGNDRGPLAAKLTSTMRDRLENSDWSAFSQVLLLFEDADPARPLVIDVIVGNVTPAARKDELLLQVDASSKDQDVTIDGKNVTFNAREQIVLKCGKASITLTRAGKVLIRGAYLLNRSSGVNKIKGGSVQIN